MRTPRVTTIDFETEAIDDRPDYPPMPGGFSIRRVGERKARYYAFGHDTENNCSKTEARRALMAAWCSDEPLLFFHGKFDVDVAMTHMSCPELPWERYHDAMFLLFLVDPHAKDLRLKPAAQRILGLPPEERDAVQEWLIEHGVIGKAQKAQWGRHILRAPGSVVGKYADGDVDRTIGLFNKLYPQVRDRGMLKAYDRERQIMPILLRNEREGIRVDLAGLRRDVPVHLKQIDKADAWLRKCLNSPGLNIDADKDMAAALDAAGVVTDWVLTKTGQRSVAKGNLTLDMFHDKKVAAVYGYRNRLATCVRMFEGKWLEMAEKSGGTIFTSWNQVRQANGGDSKGTRSGRLSSNPNLQNLSKDWKKDINENGYVHPAFLRVDPLPLVRRYILPDKNQIIVHRDYNQQELRILAHFEDGALMEEYRRNPGLDVHDYVQLLMKEKTGLDLIRDVIKPINFGIIYGMGAGKFALKLNKSVDEVRVILRAHKVALPGVDQLNRAIKALVKDGKPICTFGGREYFVEEPILMNGRWITFEYKLLNYLIQGSAADCTKQAIINYDHAKKHGRFLVTVHDEINISAPKSAWKAENKILKECMDAVEFDIPMISDAKYGPNWADLIKFKEAA